MKDKIYVGDTCGFCSHNDGLVYASCPVQYKCTFTNEFHFTTDKCNVECELVEKGGESND